MKKEQFIILFGLILGQFSQMNTVRAQVLVDPSASIDSTNVQSNQASRRIEAEGMVLSLSSSKIKQGEAFWIEVESPEIHRDVAKVNHVNQVRGWAEVDGIATPLFSWTNAKGQVVLAGPIGIPFGEKPGVSDLKVRVKGEGWDHVIQTQLIIETADPKRIAELLDLPEERVIPSSEEVATKLAEEDREIDNIFDIRSAQRTWSQRLSLPFRGKYRVTSPYGKSRIYSSRVQRRIHWGIDYALPIGTPIQASLAGRVVLVKEFGFMGKTIVIDHGYGFMTVYAHLKELNVTLGQTVDHQQIIGKSGNTGKCTGPLIHWQVVLSGVKVDPLSVFNLMKSQI